jgi:hypothetical protein
MPDDPALGAFRDDFKHVVGVFAEYPQPAKGAFPGFRHVWLSSLPDGGAGRISS